MEVGLGSKNGLNNSAVRMTIRVMYAAADYAVSVFIEKFMIEVVAARCVRAVMGNHYGHYALKTILTEMLREIFPNIRQFEHGIACGQPTDVRAICWIKIECRRTAVVQIRGLVNASTDTRIQA